MQSFRNREEGKIRKVEVLLIEPGMKVARTVYSRRGRFFVSNISFYWLFRFVMYNNYRFGCPIDIRGNGGVDHGFQTNKNKKNI